LIRPENRITSSTREKRALHEAKQSKATGERNFPEQVSIETNLCSPHCGESARFSIHGIVN
jgi:hypothetical protein